MRALRIVFTVCATSYLPLTSRTTVSVPSPLELKASPRPLKGRCRVCGFRDICGGNTRVRAFQLTGDPWWEDPACYLDDGELGIRAADYASDRPEPAGLTVHTIRHAG